MSKVQFLDLASDKTPGRLADRPLADRRSMGRGVTNKRCIENIRRYWQAKGYTVNLDIIYDGGVAVIRSDMMDGLPLALWAARRGDI